ncbi:MULTISPECIES: serine/threonine protein kinase [unclassified Marinobacterium]|uniref:serine/threonine protein kinase n=1 Tax=unclassified Marinobacterium TaxID=2644139 RepID=UPI00156829A3|nr:MULTISPECIES: serine/threonine protein kinase [unclassified Marinobacterium]NRP47650.1 serine/threonine protein kinase [Marinobacterium sp. xm-d-543]NRQ23778.1 serine/threonine protein kinase [Marinobacterium sp. xm-m-312]
MSEHPYSALTPERILDAVDAIGYRCDGRLAALNSFENRVFQLGIEDASPIISKFYRPSRWSPAQIAEEHAFCAELAASEWPLVAPLAISTGETAHQDGEFTFALFERFGGHAPELDNLDTIEVLGRSLGRLHAIGAQRPFSHRPSINIESYGVESRKFLLSHDFIPSTLREAYETLTRDLLELIEQRFNECPYTPIRIHADCHPGNILWRDDRAVFVDFDDCRMGPAVQDLWMLLSGDRVDQMDQLDVLLEGYEMFHEFDDAQLSLIEPLRTLRMMHYAAWIARRWNDPAFPPAFPWFNTERYWAEHVLELREQFANMQERPLSRRSGNY